MFISTTTSSTLSSRVAAIPDSSAGLYEALEIETNRETSRKRLIRYGLVASNALLLGAVTLFILNTAGNGNLSSSVVRSASAAGAAAVTNPLDQVSSADIALTIARMNSLPESTAINNQAQSQAATMSQPVVTDSVVSKPQVVDTSVKSRADIRSYTAQAGDTVSSLAQKFGVTSDSIRWSNNLKGDTVTAGAKLEIPPVNGFVYTVQSGDTIDSLAQKFSAGRDKLVAFNDLEIGGLNPGMQIMIPDGTKAVPTTAAQIAGGGGGGAGYAWGGAPIYGFNGYDYGYCTWYVATRVSVPANWGNANTWAIYAARDGWTVSSVPRPGAIAQTSAGAEGHVAYVEAVSDDGTMMKYSDMNGLAGFGRVGYSGWVPISKFPHYIYR